MPSFRQIIHYGVVAAVLVALGTPARSDDTSQAQRASGSAVSGNGVTLHSATADLPTGNLSFDVPGGADALNANCVACHSTGMILNQPALTQAQWTAEVTHMRKDYKAPVAEADVPAVVAELMKIRGAK